MTDEHMENRQSEKIIFYGTSWCGDCYRSRQLLKDAGIEYIDIDIDQDAGAAQKVIHLNQGYRSVPTIVFPDGTILVEPSNIELATELAKYQTP